MKLKPVELRVRPLEPSVRLRLIGEFKPRVRGKRGVQLRQRIKQRDKFTCRACGRVTTELEIDHIIPLAESGTNEDSNLQSLCRDCHLLKTSKEQSGNVAQLPNWLPKPCIPVVAVVGPPGAGKSTYVRERANANDLVLDVDEITAKQFNKAIYTETQAERDSATRYRNSALARLKDSTEYRKCWLITTASTHNARTFWRNYATEMIVLDPGAFVCEQRIRADKRRPPHVMERHVHVAKTWERIPAAPPKPPREIKGCDASGVPLGGWKA